MGVRSCGAVWFGLVWYGLVRCGAARRCVCVVRSTPRGRVRAAKRKFGVGCGLMVRMVERPLKGVVKLSSKPQVMCSDL